MITLIACKTEGAPERIEQLEPHVTAPALAPAPRPRPAALTQVTIKALGMYCEESCPLKVRYALADVPQVYELGFDVSTESIFVSYDATLGPAKQVTRPMIAATVGRVRSAAMEAWPDGASVQVVTRRATGSHGRPRSPRALPTVSGSSTRINASAINGNGSGADRPGPSRCRGDDLITIGDPT
jgi:hypothetical protein